MVRRGGAALPLLTAADTAAAASAAIPAHMKSAKDASASAGAALDPRDSLEMTGRSDSESTVGKGVIEVGWRRLTSGRPQVHPRLTPG